MNIDVQAGLPLDAQLHDMATTVQLHDIQQWNCMTYNSGTA